MSDLVGNPEDRYSRSGPHILHVPEFHSVEGWVKDFFCDKCRLLCTVNNCNYLMFNSYMSNKRS